MSALGLTSIVVAGIWLGVLTLATVLIIRQLALLTARLDHRTSLGPSANYSLADEGPEIGSRVEQAVLRWVPELGADRAHLLLLSASCTPCRGFVADLRREHLPAARPVVVLLPGREELADGIEAMLPRGVTVVRDPDASDIAQLMRMQMVPSAVTLANGVVVAKLVILHSVDQFQRFVESSDAVAMSNGSEALAGKGASHGR